MRWVLTLYLRLCERRTNHPVTSLAPRPTLFNMIQRRLFSILLALVCVSAQADDSQWDRFRGPNGSGRTEVKIPNEWTEETFRWSIDLPGVGHGSPIVWNDQVFLLSADEESGERFAIAVDAAKGKINWKRAFPDKKNKHHKYNSLASSTPAADKERVYFSWGTTERLIVSAMSHEGEPVWTADLGPVKGGHGFGASPVVHKGLVYLNNDQDGDSSLIALHARTGEIAWQVPRNSLRLTYSSPVIYKPGDEEEVIFTNWQHGITSLNPSNGSQNWEKDVFGKPSSERAIGSPIIVEDMVLGTCGFVTKLKHAVAIRHDPKTGKAEEVWRVERSVPHIPTPIYANGLVFLLNDQGMVSCVKPKDGEMLWTERTSGETFGSPVFAHDKLISVNKRGMVFMMAATDTFQKVGEYNLRETCHTTPAFSKDTMFIRTYERLHAIKGE